MQARHNRGFRQTLAGRFHVVAVCPTCRWKGVRRKIQRRSEETSRILSPLPPACATRPPCCARDTDRRWTCLVPCRDWGCWHMQCIRLLAEQQPAQTDVCFHLSPLQARALCRSFVCGCETWCAQKLHWIYRAHHSAADEYNWLPWIFPPIC